MESNNLARMLAEPDLVAISGQKASFLSGGQYPIPVPQASSSGGAPVITIEYKPYGVQLNFTPIVLGNGRIRMEVNPDVSELDYSDAVTIVQGEPPVPGLTESAVNTTVELSPGQTFAIGGMLQNQISASNTQLPILGDLPILGALFRSVNYQKDETELVILVTPVLVNALNPADVTQVPGGKWRDPKYANLYLFKDLGGEEVNTPHEPSANGPVPPFHGEVGFEPPAAK